MEVMAEGAAKVVAEDIQNERFGVVTSYLYNTLNNVLADEQKLCPRFLNDILLIFNF